MTESELLERLAELDFSERYYAYCDAHTRADSEIPRAEQEQALAATGLDFRYDAREKFFAHREETEHGPLAFHLAFSRSSLEAIVALGPRGQVVGGPYHLLAAKLAPSSRDPAYPRLPFHDSATLAEAVAFATTLFRELRASL